jgi:hypothetical protein
MFLLSFAVVGVRFIIGKVLGTVLEVTGFP